MTWPMAGCTMAQHARLPPVIQAINRRLSSRVVWALHKVYCATSGSAAYAKRSSASPGTRARNTRWGVCSCGTECGVASLLMLLALLHGALFLLVPVLWKPNAQHQVRREAGAQRTLYAVA